MPERKASKRSGRKRKQPQRKNNSKKYKHPIPSRNELLDFLNEAGKPLKADAILRHFSLKGQRMRSLLVDRLDAMVRAG